MSKETSIAKKGNNHVQKRTENDFLTEEQLKIKKMLDDIEDLEPGQSIIGDYFKFSIGDKVKAIVLGTKLMPSKNEQERKEGKMIEAVRLLARVTNEETGEQEDKEIVTAEVVLRNNLGKFAKMADNQQGNTPVYIECIGETISNSGKYKLFEINILEKKGK